MLGHRQERPLLIAALAACLLTAPTANAGERPSAQHQRDVMSHPSQHPRLRPTTGSVDVMRRLGMTGMRPRSLDWRGSGQRASDRFHLGDRYLSNPWNLVLPRYVPDPDRWARAQEQWLFAGELDCQCGDAPIGGSPGRVPDGDDLPGLPLEVGRDGQAVDLSWSASCEASATDYSVHDGSIGNWYSHSQLACSTAGSTFANVSPAAGDRYFLIVPLTIDDEGSYGVDSTNAQRPDSASTCRPTFDLTPCQ